MISFEPTQPKTGVKLIDKTTQLNNQKIRIVLNAYFDFNQSFQ